MKISKLPHFISLNFSHLGVIGLLFVANISSAIAANAPGVLAQEPLQTSATAKPNILFHLDNSGSMFHIVIENTSSDTCTNASALIPNGSTVTMSITGTGASSSPEITYGGDTRSYGNTGSTFCFVPTGTYYSMLRTNNNTYIDDIAYTGEQLNWYFDTATDGTGDWDATNHKPGARDRHTIARAALKGMLNDLSNVRVGLSSFDGGNGASLDVEVALLTPSHISTLETAVDGISQLETTPTPLGESLIDLGRYLSNTDTGTANCGGGSTNLTIHPNDALVAAGGLKKDVACTTLLDTRITVNGPITAWCQKNFAVMLTDGQPTDDRNIASDLEDYDQDCTAAGIAAGTHTSCDTNDGKNNVTYPSYNPSDHWDDVAQALFEIDLRPDLDEGGNEVLNNLTTYTIGFADEQVKNHPLISQTAAQGGGSFIYAEDAANLASAFKVTLNSIIGLTSTSSAVTFNSSTLSSQSAVYQALFNTASWSGELNSFPIDGITGAINTGCTQGTNNCWEAASQLDAQDADDRFILVASDASSKYAVELTNPSDYTSLNSSSDIPQALVDDLCSVAVGTVSGTSFPCLSSDTGSAKTANSAYISDLVDYLRGDNSNEGSSSARAFRARLSNLGDIVNSSPVFVGAPQQNWPKTGVWPDLDGSSVDISYTAWKSGTTVSSRPEIVYVASNDGMLHGFRAEAATGSQGENVNTSAGEEVFAFIPSDTFSTVNTSGLHFFANSNYSHRFNNDLTPTIADVYMDYKSSAGGATGTYNVTTMAKATSTADWRTVLLGSQGGGGKSVYLLDVTDPLEYTTTTKQNAKKLLLWEFSDSDDSSLGYTYSRPVIAMMNNGKFAAIFGNGYNSAGCKAELFVVFLEGGLDGDWTDTGDYYKYDTGTAHGGGAGDCNGLSTPAVVDLNGDGTADRVYAGDLKGNLWVFDLCNSANALTGNACSMLPDTTSGWGLADADPLMNANDGTIGQPITSKPVVSRDPASSGSADLIVVFGTGQYLTDADKLTTGTQRVYGVRDYDALNNSATGGGGAWNLDGNQTSPDKWADTTFAINAGTGARVFASTDTIGSGDYGWRITLPDSGERMVVNPKIRNNILFFNTLIPDNTTCSFGGSGWILSVNLLNGGIPAFPVFDLDGSNTIGDAGDTTTDGIPAGTKLNEIPAESTFLGDNQYTPGSDGTINVRKTYVGDSRDEGRMSWKEIYEAQ